MSTDGSKPIFPITRGPSNTIGPGLSHREWLVGMAMKGLLSGTASRSLTPKDIEWLTKTAHTVADSTLAATPKENTRLPKGNK